MFSNDVEINEIRSFRNKYHFLSNFYLKQLVYNNFTYQTSEHAYQAAKGNDKEEHDYIAQSETPAIAKRRGKEIRLRGTWKSIKVRVMLEIVQAKFVVIDGDTSMYDKLLSTDGFTIVEGNTWHDNFWGDCSCNKCSDVFGYNWLGTIIMSVRRQNLKENECRMC